MKNLMSLSSLFTRISLGFCLFVVLNCFNTNIAFGDWQSKLESYFDFVDTFDDLADWSGSVGSFTGTSGMPKKIDGNDSIWTHYTNDTAAVDDWIKDHGQDYRWGGSGKSLCINYNNFVGGIDGYGPSRLGLYVGDGDPKSGYKKIYVFFMVKFRPGFFTMNGSGTFEYVGVFKFFEIWSGFRSINDWGTTSEQSSACDLEQYKHGYGLNGTVFNVGGGGISYSSQLLFVAHGVTAEWDSSSSCYKYAYTNSDDYRNGSNIEDAYLNDEWFGVEFAMDIGTVGNNDGTTDVWIYDQNGTEISHSSRTDYNQLMIFDHYYNKVIIGGNRFGSDYGQDPGDSNENRFYVDDFIIHSSRIGLTYFTLLQPPKTVKKPTVKAIN